MPEYIYTDAYRHEQTATLPMTSTAVVICTACGAQMWRKPQPISVTWGGLRPSQGEIHPDIKQLIDGRPQRLEAEAQEKEQANGS
jgi:hypothetical protein